MTQLEVFVSSDYLGVMSHFGVSFFGDDALHKLGNYAFELNIVCVCLPTV